MEPANLLAHRLRKLVGDGKNAEVVGDAIRQLLEVERAAHASAHESAGFNNIESLNRLRLVR